MPPSRRHPRPTPPPARRPRVAGLRRPGAPAKDTGPDRAAVVDDVDDVGQIEQVEEPVDREIIAVPVIGEPEADTETEPDTEPEAEDESVEDKPVEDEPAIVLEPPAKRVRPVGKRRATGLTQPADLADAEAEVGGSTRANAKDEQDETRASRNRTVNWAIALGVVAVLLAGIALLFRGQANRLSDGADANNQALVKTGPASEVSGQVRDTVEKTLTYNYTDLESTAKAVKENLTGIALCEYDKLFGPLQKLAPEQKIVLTTRVREIGVTRLEGDSAVLLVFIDQTSTRADQNQTAASGAQFEVGAERKDGRWKITRFDMLGQPLPNGQPVPQC